MSKNNIQTKKVLVEKINRKALYLEEGKRRMVIRKEKRLEKFTRNREFRKSSTCQGCGEDPYCYCGDGTPYSY